MTLTNFFKKKSKEKPIKEKTKPIEKSEKIEEEKIKPTKKETKTIQSYQILKAPHVTEKATKLTEKNQYIFKVWPRANKTEIKKSIEDLYGVNVVSVKMIRIPPKRRRLGRISGWRKGYKKAIVKIKKGQKIELLLR